MPHDTLKTERDGPALYVQIHRPEAGNSIDARLTAELLAALDAAERDAAAKLFVLEGLPDVFCTGMDFQAVSHAVEAGSAADDAGAYWQVLERMSGSPLVVAALVRGKVNAGGVGLVAASDLVLADRTATFSLSELLFGLMPACVLPFLIRRVGFQKARLLALTTRTIDAAEAHRWGLVDELGDDPRLLLRRQATRLACLSGEAVGRLKEYTERLWIIGEETRRLAVGTISGLLADAEVQARIRRFVKEGVYPWQA
jgi:polyketide biosynthesis enoyl-CoA hydratase PksH